MLHHSGVQRLYKLYQLDDAVMRYEANILSKCQCYIPPYPQNHEVFSKTTFIRVVQFAVQKRHKKKQNHFLFPTIRNLNWKLLCKLPSWMPRNQRKGKRFLQNKRRLHVNQWNVLIGCVVGALSLLCHCHIHSSIIYKGLF